jgi:minimal PKS acyl carrier protein
MSPAHLTYPVLAEAIAASAGVSVAAADLADAPSFEGLGVDSLGLLGTVAQLERDLQVTLGTEFERCGSPAELLAKINDRLTAGDAR